MLRKVVQNAAASVGTVTLSGPVGATNSLKFFAPDAGDDKADDGSEGSVDVQSVEDMARRSSDRRGHLINLLITYSPKVIKIVILTILLDCRVTNTPLR
jgi:hypothetical protein